MMILYRKTHHSTYPLFYHPLCVFEGWGLSYRGGRNNLEGHHVPRRRKLSRHVCVCWRRSWSTCKSIRLFVQQICYCNIILHNVWLVIIDYAVPTLPQLLSLLHGVCFFTPTNQARKLRKYKERRLNGYHGGPNMGENLADVLNSLEGDDAASSSNESDESFMDPDQAVVTKVKRWVVADIFLFSCMPLHTPCFDDLRTNQM